MTNPRYQEVPPERLPVVELDEGRVKVKVIAGNALGKLLNLALLTRWRVGMRGGATV